jgi:hypothetical protein
VYDTAYQRLGVVDCINLHGELYYTNIDRQQPYTIYMQRVDACLPVLTADERLYLTEQHTELLNGTHYITMAEVQEYHKARKQT